MSLCVGSLCFSGAPRSVVPLDDTRDSSREKSSVSFMVPGPHSSSL